MIQETVQLTERGFGFGSREICDRALSPLPLDDTRGQVPEATWFSLVHNSTVRSPLIPSP